VIIKRTLSGKVTVPTAKALLNGRPTQCKFWEERKTLN